MELPKKWPGRVVVRQALTIMRIAGRWDDSLQLYVEASRKVQVRLYPKFRYRFYWDMYRIDPDHNRIGR
jgi:hypothetical protein